MAEAFSTRELEWFDLETRMRELLHEQLSPIISKAKADREAHSQLKKAHEELTSRVKHLETFTLGDAPGESTISQIYARMTEMEANRKSDHVSLEQELLLGKEKMKSFQFQLTGCQELTSRLENMNDMLNADLRTLKEMIENHQELVVSEMKGLNDAFKEMNETYTDYAVKTEEKAQRALNKCEGNEMELSNFRGEIENFKVEISEARAEIRNLYAVKLDKVTFEEEQQKVSERFEFQKRRDDELFGEIRERDSFVDKHVPLRVSTMISDCLHSCLEPFALKKFAEFEHNLLIDLNNNAVNPEIDLRQEAVQKILQDMKHVEQRKVEILSETQQPSKAPPAPTHSNAGPAEVQGEKRRVTVTAPPPPTVEVPEIDVEGALNKFMIEVIKPEISKLRAEVNQKIDSSSKMCKLRTEESMVQAQLVASQIEESEKKIRRERGDSMLLITQNKQSLEDLKKDFLSNRDFIGSIALMMVCLVENAQIQHALESQDEKDRHTTANNFEKEFQTEIVGGRPKPPDHSHYTSSIPSANFSFQKKCLSCGNPNSILTGFRTSLVYQPTPLFYRNQRFKRLELISLMGRMLESCWGMVADNLPWNKGDFENILNEASRFIKNSNSFTEESKAELAEQGSKDSLPLLVSPAVRNKTPFKNKKK